MIFQPYLWVKGRPSGVQAPAGEQFPGRGRYHRVSLATLLGAENFYNFGYTDIADVLRRVSDRTRAPNGIFERPDDGPESIDNRPDPPSTQHPRPHTR